MNTQQNPLIQQNPLTEHSLIFPDAHCKDVAPFWKVCVDGLRVTVYNVAPDGHTGFSVTAFISKRLSLESLLPAAISRAEQWNAEGLGQAQAQERMEEVSREITARAEAYRVALPKLSDRRHANDPLRKFPHTDSFHLFRAHPSIFGLDESDLENE